MTASFSFIVEPLGNHHDKKSFCCGVDALDGYFKTQAGQDAKKHVAAPFVLVDTEKGKVAGFYTLSMSHIETRELPDDMAKKLPRYPHIPSVLMGRLAVDQAYKGQKLGAYLLVDALKRGLEISASVAAAFFVVDAKDDNARQFYTHFGFALLDEDTNRLYLPIKSIKDLP